MKGTDMTSDVIGYKEPEIGYKEPALTITIHFFHLLNFGCCQEVKTYNANIAYPRSECRLF